MAIDRYYVCLKDAYSVPHFRKHIPFWPKHRYLISTDLVGGQAKCLIVVCKEAFLKNKEVSKMVESYIAFPRITWVDKGLIELLSKSVNANEELSLTVRSVDTSITINNVAKVSYATYQATSNESPCKN